MKPMVHVVDDDESLRTALLRLLKGSGFEATGYRSTGEFLVHHPADRHGCVLLDIYLPGGPSGLGECSPQGSGNSPASGVHNRLCRRGIMMKLGDANSVAELGGSQNGCARWAKNPADRLAWTVALTRKGRFASSPSSC